MSRRGACAGFLVWLGALVAPAAAATNVALYQRVEETMINAASFANRFTDTELRLTVTAPPTRVLGASFTWYGFNDGNGAGAQNGNVWKFRLLFDTPGTWLVDAGFYVPGTSTPNGPTQQFAYVVSAVPIPGEHGHVRVDPQNAFRLRQDDGTPWVPFSIHSSGLLDRDQTIGRQWIDQHALLNVNALAVRFHSEAYGSDPERYHFLLTNGTSGTTWPASGVNGFDYSRYDVPVWRYNEQVIEYAYAKGLKLSIWFGISGLNTQYNSYGPQDWPNDTTLSTNQKRFIRYFLSRWAPYTHFWHWTVDSEYEEGGGGALNRVRTYAAELQARNPWKTIITTHVLSNWSPGASPELDLATLQRRVADTDAGTTDCRSFITSNAGYNRPVYNCEGIWNMSNVTRARVASWTHIMSGGFGHIAHFGFDSDPLSASWQVTWDHVDPRHKEDAAELGRLNAFFNKTPGIDISRCVVSNNLVSVTGGNLALCLAEVSRSYYIWLDRGGTGFLSLAGVGKYSITRYRCAQLTAPTSLGTVVGGGVVSLGATPTTGFGNEYLFVVKRAPSTTNGDFDGDGDVDMTDFAHLQACITPQLAQVGAGCGDANLNGVGAVDNQDVSIFTACMRGPDQPPGCQ